MSIPLSRRAALAALAGVTVSILGRPRLGHAQAGIPMVVYKDPNCGCCSKWVDHMNANGFTASVSDTREMDAIKVRYKVADNLRSCHTTVVGGYVIEGHVPAEDVKKLLALKPKGIIGLTIPGMPASAPGMDLKPFQAYAVRTFDAKGITTVFVTHDK
jgi:hypothetical protein